ncbi:MAG: heme biosynthesis HemY N-terminal domain-containing protein [Candidatus Dactylopiibacterium sp.]|nr:heme biosynthesis HemY N-terminal domain-containing protein [Candidatus Dactylopiibacterium sp.]
MRILLWLLGLFALAAAVTVAARYNDAYALFVWHPWRIQISMNLLALLAVLAFFVLYRLTRIAVRAVELPREVAAWRARRRVEQAQSRFMDAQRFYREGRYGQAFRGATEAYAGLPRPGLAALLAARAAHAMRDTERRDTWLGHAAAHDREIRIARLMAEAEMAVTDRRFGDAAIAIEALKASGHRHLAVNRLAMQVEQGRGRWQEVARLARTLRKHSALSAEQAAPLLNRALLEQLRDAEGDLDALTRVWNDIPEAERHDVGFLIRAVPYFINAGDRKLALAALQTALDADWEPELASLYGRCQGADMREQLAVAENWLKTHPDDASLLLTLGRLCLRAQLWGKAQSYFEASLSQQVSRTAHLELARLAEQLGRKAEAETHYRLAATLGA